MSTAMEAPQDIDSFGWINKFPDFELVKEFLKEHNVKENIINLFEENYGLIKQSDSIKQKLLGRNIISPLFAAIQSKALPVFLDSLLKMAQEDKENREFYVC